jgi:hypothetical protein
VAEQGLDLGELDAGIKKPFREAVPLMPISA